MTAPPDTDNPAWIPCWIPCPSCDCFWCTIHDQHVHDCDCPPIEDWWWDPYSRGGR